MEALDDQGSSGAFQSTYEPKKILLDLNPGAHGISDVVSDANNQEDNE